MLKREKKAVFGQDSKKTAFPIWWEKQFFVDSLKSSEGNSFEYLTFGAFADGLGSEPETSNRDYNPSNMEYY